jgi:mRNA interferase HicA
MKRKKLLQHLREQGCELLREGGRHSWWHNPQLNKRTAVPRHVDINDLLAKKICKDLGLDPPRSS